MLVDILHNEQGQPPQNLSGLWDLGHTLLEGKDLLKVWQV